MAPYFFNKQQKHISHIKYGIKRLNLTQEKREVLVKNILDTFTVKIRKTFHKNGKFCMMYV